ncbi:hypothetical protein EJ06DRAFT_534673 [Trichodelitschia bisporula]|uniref:Cupredoxin n=1 Tax=Trichodelitschia bisporula TaxID=703511 RepID=A0A6G1HIM0_9PEZI|nr:hypothetical protein EJ06DRAFT_534673 [Trichodelitschia bisporula]
MHASILLATFAALAAAKQIPIVVGDGGDTFSPSSVTAEKGDVVVFSFKAGNHGVAQGDFDKPCQPSAGGFWTGFKNDGTFSVTVTDPSKPMWFYCPLNKHCQNGMVGVINPSGGTLDAYTAASKKASSNTPPSGDPTVDAGSSDPGSSDAPGTSSADGSSARTTAVDSASTSAQATSKATDSATGTKVDGSSATGPAASPKATGSGAGALSVPGAMALIAGAVALL